VRLAILNRMGAKQMLPVMIADCGPHIGLSGSHRTVGCDRLIGQRLVRRANLAPLPAPLGPIVDRRDQSIDVVGVNASRDISRNEMRENQINLRIRRHFIVAPVKSCFPNAAGS
jgi:hypothetical protein